MCERCDEVKRRLGLTEEEFQEKMEAQSAFDVKVIPEILDFLLVKLNIDKDYGPPSVLHAIAVAAGMIIAKAPKELRGMLLTTMASRITETMNDALPDDEKLGVVIGSDIDKVRRELDSLENLTVTPPVLH